MFFFHIYGINHFIIALSIGIKAFTGFDIVRIFVPFWYCFAGCCSFYWPAGFTRGVHKIFAWYFSYSIRTTSSIFPTVLLSIWWAEFCHGHTTAATNGQSKFWFPLLLFFPFFPPRLCMFSSISFVKRVCCFLSSSNVVETGLPLPKQIGLWVLSLVTWTTIKPWWNFKRIRGSVWRKITGRDDIVITITENLSMRAIGTSACNALMTKGNLPGRLKTLEWILFRPLMMTKMPWEVSLLCHLWL